MDNLISSVYSWSRLGVALGLMLIGAAGYLAMPPSARAADRDCSDFGSQASAQDYFDQRSGSPTNNVDNLDGDGDGRVCESLPCPCVVDGAGSEGPSIPAGHRIRARVIEAIDGDTLKVRIRSTRAIVDVRLIGIDTPETKRPATPVECGGPGASRSMGQMADGRMVTLVTDPTQDRLDRYGRLLAYAIRGGVDLNRAQIRRGWAETYVYNDNPFRRVDEYRRDEEAARSEHRGMWELCGGNFHSAG